MNQCKRCGLHFSRKQTLVNHLQRVNTCEALLENISVEQLLNEMKKPKLTEGFQCEYCELYFKNSQGKYQHKRSCKKKPKESIRHLIHKVDELTKELDTLKTNSYTYNVQQNNNFININLKEFGLESQQHLSQELLNRCFADKGIVELIQNLHFDKTCPENHNVRLKSKKQELMEIYSDGKWQVKDQDQTLTELIQSGYRILRMHGKKNKENIMEEEGMDENDFNEITGWLENIYEDQKFQKPVKRDLIILFINNQTMLLGREHD